MNMSMNGIVGMAALGLAATASGQGAAALVFEPLPYAFDGLEPHVDARTMEIHYGKHHQAYFNNLTKALQAYEELEVGGVMINQVPTFRVENMPYGGVKESGAGREGVRYAMEEMTEPRSLVVNRG